MNKENDEINLVNACVNGMIDEVRLYRDKLGTVNFVSPKSDTPLNAAAANGHLEVVKFLVEQGADFSLKDSYGLSAIETARKSDHDDVVQFLASLEQ